MSIHTYRGASAPDRPDLATSPPTNKNGAKSCLAPFARRISVGPLLSRRCGRYFASHPRQNRNRLKLKRIIARGNHRHRNRAICRPVQVLRLQPGAQPRIVNVRLTLPEIGLQSALNAEMPQLQFNVLRTLREIPAHVVRTNMQSSKTVTLALRFDHHKVPALHIG
jgi:hypothetical protein